MSSTSRISAAMREVFVSGSALGGMVAEPPDAVNVLPRLIEKGSGGAFRGDFWAGIPAVAAVTTRKMLKMRPAWYIDVIKKTNRPTTGIPAGSLSVKKDRRN